MEGTQKNKMAEAPMKKLLLKMGLPMIISMVLQALYNVIDSIFVANMGEQGAIANQALTLAFPIQILIIAIGVGTGIGLNALLSKSLGEKNQEKVNKVAGNGIFLSICIFIVFLLFGLFGSKWFISLFAGGNQEVISMGTTYLKICTCLSLGSIGYTVYERFLQATGKTMLSTISQISGAVTNIVWWTFPIAEILTSIISVFILKRTHKEKIAILEEKTGKNTINNKLIISISREHGTGGKEIARKVAQKLELKFFDKEEIKKFAIENSLIENKYQDDELYKFYLSLEAEKDSIIKQAETIKMIANKKCIFLLKKVKFCNIII